MLPSFFTENSRQKERKTALEYMPRLYSCRFSLEQLAVMLQSCIIVLVNYTVYLMYLSPSNFTSILTRTVVVLSGQFCDFFQRSPFYRGVVLPRSLLHRRVSLDLGEGAARFRRGGAHPCDGPTLHVLRCVSYRLLPTNNGCGQSSCSQGHDIRQYVVM